MDDQQNTRSLASSEAVGSFYDQMEAFFDSIFGENIHFGLWDEDEKSSMPHAQNHLTDRLIDLLQPKDDQYILDVGCGTGHPALRLAAHTRARILGVSISTTHVTRANAKARSADRSPQLDFVRADAMHLPAESGTFDAAWAIEMLFHVPDRLQVLREIHRTLKPGGRIVLTDFIRTGHLTDDDWNLLTQGFAFSTLLTADTYADAITQSGLELVNVHDVTAQTRQNMHWIRSRYADEREHLATHYGQDFIQQMDQLLPVGMSIYADKLGYVIAEARRPLDPEHP
ncbi:SAM-dependent methyltransferase [Kitasatospora sp. NPDC054768]